MIGIWGAVIMIAFALVMGSEYLGAFSAYGPQVVLASPSARTTDAAHARPTAQCRRSIVHVFGGWGEFPLYDLARSGGWYDFGFLIGVGSPLS